MFTPTSKKNPKKWNKRGKSRQNHLNGRHRLLTLIASISSRGGPPIGGAAAAAAAAAAISVAGPPAFKAAPGTKVLVRLPMSLASCCPFFPLNILAAASLSYKTV